MAWKRSLFDAHFLYPYKYTAKNDNISGMSFFLIGTHLSLFRKQKK